MNEEAEKILDTVQVGAIATINRDRTPLITPLYFARLEDSIIWLSDPATRHSENVFRNGKIEFVVWNEQKQAVFVNTTAGELPEEQKEAALEAYKKKLGDFLPPMDKEQIYAAPIGKIDDNSTTQNVWHFVA